MSDIRHAIVGIDPGATVAIAGLDLSGRLLFAESFRNEGIGEAARRIEKLCTPSLFACDTQIAPEGATRLASYFSCRLFSPQQNVREDDKKIIARGIGVANVHERDAYCAATLAYRFAANRLRQIDALEGLAFDEKERVKHMLLKGVRVQDAFLLLSEPEPSGKEEGVHAITAPKKQVSAEELRSRLETLVRENANLRLTNERLEGEKGALLRRVGLLENGVRVSLLRDSEFRKLRAEVERLRFPIRRRAKKEAVRGKLGEKSAGMARQEKPGPQKREESGLRQGVLGQQPASKLPEPRIHPPKDSDGEAGLNNLGELNVDLESLVREYRKGRKYSWSD